MGMSPHVGSFIVEWRIMSGLCHCEVLIRYLNDSSLVE